MSTKAKDANGKKSTVSFKWSDSNTLAIVKAWSSKGEYIWQIARLLHTAKASAKKDYEHVAKQLLAKSELVSRVSFDKESNEYVVNSLSASTLSSYHKLYSYFMVAHAAKVTEGLKAGAKANLDHAKKDKLFTVPKELDNKSFFILLVSTQLTHATKFVNLASSPKEDIRKSLNGLDAFTLAKWIQQGKVSELAKQLPKPRQNATKDKAHTIEIDSEAFARMQGIKKVLKLNTKSFEDTFETMYGRYTAMQDNVSQAQKDISAKDARISELLSLLDTHTARISKLEAELGALQPKQAKVIGIKSDKPAKGKPATA